MNWHVIGAIAVCFLLWWGIYEIVHAIWQGYIPFPICHDGRCG